MSLYKPSVNTEQEADEQTIWGALHHGLEYWGHELDDVTGQVHALSPEAKRFEAALAALGRYSARLAAAEQEIERLTQERDETRENNAWAGDVIKTADEARIAAEQERDEARELVEQLRRHGCDWLIEGIRSLAAENARLTKERDEAICDSIRHASWVVELWGPLNEPGQPRE